MITKKNCWEFKNCGRHAGGPSAAELGVCPAAIDSAYDGTNGGKNGGRYCWWVAGTFCDGEVQGLWATKLATCATCDFFKQVRKEEGEGFQM